MNDQLQYSPKEAANQPESTSIVDIHDYDECQTPPLMLDSEGQVSRYVADYLYIRPASATERLKGRCGALIHNPTNLKPDSSQEYLRSHPRIGDRLFNEGISVASASAVDPKRSIIRFTVGDHLLDSPGENDIWIHSTFDTTEFINQIGSVDRNPVTDITYYGLAHLIGKMDEQDLSLGGIFNTANRVLLEIPTKKRSEAIKNAINPRERLDRETEAIAAVINMTDYMLDDLAKQYLNRTETNTSFLPGLSEAEKLKILRNTFGIYVSEGIQAGILDQKNIGMAQQDLSDRQVSIADILNQRYRQSITSQVGSWGYAEVQRSADARGQEARLTSYARAKTNYGKECPWYMPDLLSFRKALLSQIGDETNTLTCLNQLTELQNRLGMLRYNGNDNEQHDALINSGVVITHLDQKVNLENVIISETSYEP